MKKFSVFLCAILLVLGTSGVASASLFLSEQAGSWDINDSTTQTWEFDLDATTPMDSDDIITDAYFNAFATYSAYNDEAEIQFDMGSIGTYNWQWIIVGYGILADVYTEVVGDHYLKVGMTAADGDRFTVKLAGVGGCYTAVPEPATMLLLGCSIFGIAGIGRKKFFKK
jgi:hypothetical protein